jgi:two-component system LytT family response regulator
VAPFRALIVDDEPLARRGIRQLLAPYREVAVAGECRDGTEALRALATTKPDLVFLDVEMPGLDGMSVVQLHGAERMPATVFVTAHEEFAVRAFDAAAVDYLVKPLAEGRFRTMMARVLTKLRAQSHRRIAVPTSSGELLLDAGEIDWIEAENDHAAIHAGGRRFRVRQSLATFESQLDPARFARVHRSAIVRLDHVREVHPAAITLRDGTELPVSRRRAAQVKGLLHRSPRQSDRLPPGV